MGKAVRRVRGEGQKDIIALWESLIGRHSGWEVWQDFIIMSAISIANALGGPYEKDREDEYMARAGKYTPQEMEASRRRTPVIPAATRQSAYRRGTRKKT